MGIETYIASGESSMPPAAFPIIIGRFRSMVGCVSGLFVTIVILEEQQWCCESCLLVRNAVKSRETPGDKIRRFGTTCDFLGFYPGLLGIQSSAVFWLSTKHQLKYRHPSELRGPPPGSNCNGRPSPILHGRICRGNDSKLDAS